MPHPVLTLAVRVARGGGVPVRQRSRDTNELIVSYLFLRQTVGWIGTLLPIVLLAGAAFTSTARGRTP